VSGKSVLKLTSSFVLIVLLGGLLTSCGASEEEKALKANCDRIFANLKEIGDRPEIFKSSQYAEGHYMASLYGEGTRKEVERKILAKYPFLDEIIVGKEKGRQQTDLYYYSGSIFLIAEALKGTDIEFPYSREEMLAISTQENGWRDVVNPLATKIFGDYLELTDHQGCAVIDQIRVEERTEGYSSDYNTGVAFYRASQDYLDFAEFLQVIRNCEVSGWHVTRKCAKVDYVSEPYTYTQSNELTEEEKAILAERERDSQGSTGSTETLNVTPFQLCDSLGQVVQTESYGQLICKYVLINRIRTLAWIRS
jgi:hypothetical protein